MILDLTSLDRGRGDRLEETFRLEPGSPVFAGYEGEIEEPFTLEASLSNLSADSYILDARLSGTVVRPCRRCLRPVAVPVQDEIRIVYQFVAGRKDSGDDDVRPLEPDTHRIDLTDPVRDRLFLGTEQYPVCREDCKGICPHCGQDLNTGSCDCAVESSDSRWAALETVRSLVEHKG